MKTERIRTAIRLRLPGSVRWRRLWMALGDWLHSPGQDEWAMLRLMCRVYFCGGGHAGVDPRLASQWHGDGPLWHITPAENLPSIFEKGLIPVNGLVWLTDTPEALWPLIARYNARRGQNELALLQADMARCCRQGRRCWYTEAKGELVCFHVPPDCLRAVPPPKQE